jgi:hypothetical protein
MYWSLARQGRLAAQAPRLAQRVRSSSGSGERQRAAIRVQGQQPHAELLHVLGGALARRAARALRQLVAVINMGSCRRHVPIDPAGRALALLQFCHVYRSRRDAYSGAAAGGQQRTGRGASRVRRPPMPTPACRRALSVTVRMGEVDTIEYHRDRGMAVTVYFGHRKGSASTADLRPEAVQRDGHQGLRDRAPHGQR